MSPARLEDRSRSEHLTSRLSIRGMSCASCVKAVERTLGALEGVEKPVEIIRAACLAYAEFFQKHPQLVEILIIERAEFRDSIPATHLVYREKNRGIIDDILRRGIASGEFRKVNVREATNVLANMLYGTVVCGCLEGSSRRLKRMAEHSIDVFLHGVLTPSRKEPRRK